MLYRTPFKVAGRWPFPADMLRYDDCKAATPEDQAIIDSLSGETMLDRRRYEVNMQYIGSRRFFEPTCKRWESFLWRVVEVGNEERITR